MTAAATALLGAELRSRYRTLLALCAGTFVFLLVLAGTFTALGGASGLAKSFGREQPAILSAFAGTRHANLFTPENYVGLGFLHPLFLVLTLAVGISIGTAAVAGDIETGRVELLYTRPLRRTTLLDARLGVWVVAQLAVVAAGVIGAWLGTRISQDLQGISAVLFLRIAVQYLPLAVLFAAVAFVASSTARTRGHALAVTVGVAALSYLVNFLALLWHPLAWAQRITPFGYYAPLDSIDSVDLGNIVVLLAAAGVLLFAARWWVERRDLV
jgi:ABC-2 type transport system permease protein